MAADNQQQKVATVADGKTVPSTRPKALHTVEDVESLLNVLLLVSALMLSFSISNMFVASHKDLLESDARAMINQRAIDGIPEDCAALPSGCVPKKWNYVTSWWLARRGLLTLTCYFASITVAIATYISLHLIPHAREDPIFFDQWFAVFKIVIFCGYGLFIVGNFFFFQQIVVLVEVVFPKYTDELEDIFDVTTGKMVETYDYNKPSYIQNMASVVGVGSIVGMVVLLVIPILLSAWLHRRHKNATPAGNPSHKPVSAVVESN